MTALTSVRQVRFGGDANTGLGKFSIFEQIGGYDAVKELIDVQSLLTWGQYEETYTVPVSTTDFLIDLTGLPGVIQYLFLSFSAAATIKFGDQVTAVPISGISVMAVSPGTLKVTNASTSVVLTVRVVAAG